MSESKPHVVGIEILKQNGLDVDELIKQLVINSSVEFTAYYYFTLLRANCTGMEGEGVKGVIEDARMEDLSHFESCIERIYQLGGLYQMIQLITSRCLVVNFFNCQIIRLI